jgi:hypothetical protein
MPDELDLASEREEFARTHARNVRKPEAPAATGLCLYCDEDVASPRRWCDTDCRDAWDKRSKLNRSAQ